MDYLQVFAIASSGMQVQKTRLEVAAHNLANINTVANADGRPFQPMRVVSAATSAPASGLNFGMMLEAQQGLGGAMAQVVADHSTPPRLVHEPAHPHADASGKVRYPGVSHLDQMMTVTEALRAYEANVAAMQAARMMANRALEIGAGQ